MLQMNINPIVLKRYESGCIEHVLEDFELFSASFLSIVLLKCLEDKNFINENWAIYCRRWITTNLTFKLLALIVKAHFLI